tara:strand:+ start:316 stop:492 length:177 start_codon:yes stop_codon:yes gene_type:complete
MLHLSVLLDQLKKKILFWSRYKIIYMENDNPSTEKSFFISRGSAKKLVEMDEWEFIWQ